MVVQSVCQSIGVTRGGLGVMTPLHCTKIMHKIPCIKRIKTVSKVYIFIQVSNVFIILNP